MSELNQNEDPRAGTQGSVSHGKKTEKKASEESISRARAHGKDNFSTPRDAALSYARRGFEVFPASPENKQSHKSEKYSGTKWGKTLDPIQVEKDFEKWPEANVGIATGPGTGFWAIDLDVKDNGIAEFASLVEDMALPETVTVETPSGGRHYWFKWPEEGGVSNSVQKLGPGIDVRGKDGIVLAPPSLKRDGSCYRFAPGLSPNEVEIAEAPEELLELVRNASRKNRKKQAAFAKRTNEIGVMTVASAKHKIGIRVADLLRVLGQAKVGERNDTLNRLAYTIGGLAHHLDSDEVLANLLSEVSNWEEPDKTEETAERAFRDGLEKEPIPLELGLDDLLLSHDDLANYVNEYGVGQDFIHVFEWGWHQWTGHTWHAVDDHVVERQVSECLRRVQGEVDKIGANEAHRVAANAASGSNTGPRSVSKVRQKAKSIRHLLGSVQYDHAVVQKLAAMNGVSAKDFNSDPLLLGTPNGVVNLRTGKIRPGRREDFISRSTSVAPTDQKAERWERTLKEAFPGQPEMHEFLQRIAGMSLTGLTRDEKFFFFYGDGGNGKGTFLEPLYHVMGDYSTKASADVFLSNTSASSTQNDLAMMDGSRLVWGDEIPPGRKWNTANIKNLTGGDTIVAKRLYRDKYAFKPQATVIMAGNHKPGVAGVDAAIRRRMVLIEFKRKHDEATSDSKLKEHLMQYEASGILAWQIEGARKYVADGLAIPDSVNQASSDYLDSEDAILEFVSDCCVADENEFVSSKTLYPIYKIWADELGIKLLGQRTLTKMLEERGFKKDQVKSARGVRGLRLKSGDEVEL